MTETGLEQSIELLATVKKFREIREQLRQQMEAMFPPGKKVLVDDARYKGEAVVHRVDNDGVGCIVPNGNIWYYPVESVHEAWI